MPSKNKNIKILLISVLILLVIVLLNLISIPDYINGTENVVYVITMPPQTMKEQFIAGNIDGFIAWEPFNADLILNENASYLIQSSDVWPDHNCCVLSTKTEDEDVVKALIWTHIKATEFINNPINYEKVVEYATEFTGRDEDVVKEALEHMEYVEYPDEEQFKVYYYRLKELKYLKQTPEELGYSNENVFLDSLLTKSYYNELKNKLEENSNWRPEFVSKTINFGYLTADLHQLAFHIALKEGYYEAVFKELKPTRFNSGNYIMDAYNANLLDAGYVGSGPVVNKGINEGIIVKVIGGTNNLGSAIVVRKDIKSLNDLSGKVIAIPGFGGIQDIILRMVAESVGLKVVVRK